MADFWSELTKPFPVEDIRWRVGSTSRDKSKAMVLAYLDARAIRRRLDEVAGPAGWKVSYKPCARAQGPLAWVCTLSVVDRDGGEVSRSDVADDTDVEPGKGGASDAFKRAFYAFGCDYLYRLGDTWVDLKPSGQHYAGKGPNGSLYFDTPRLPAWALPGGTQAQPSTAQAAPRPAQAAKPTQPAQAQPTTAVDMQAAAVDGAAPPIPEEPYCPICGGSMWDNRENKRNPKAPDWKCKDKDCRDPAGDGRFPPAWFRHDEFAKWFMETGGTPLCNQGQGGPVEQAAEGAGMEPVEELPF